MALTKIFLSVQECFCGCTLQQSTWIILIFDLISSLFSFGISLYLITDVTQKEEWEMFEIDQLWPKLYAIFIILAAIYSIGAVFSCIAVHGLYKNLSGRLKLWLFYQLFSTLLVAVLLFLVAIFIKAYTHDVTTVMFIVLYTLLYLVLRWALASVVHSFYFSMGTEAIQGYSLQIAPDGQVRLEAHDEENNSE